VERSRGRVEDTVANPEPPMLLALPHPHHELRIKALLGSWIVARPMDRPCRLRVRREASVDVGVGVRLRRGIWVVLDVDRRLALVSQSICLELTNWLATMCIRLRERQHVVRNDAELSAARLEQW
jgi:hypothetical protein